MPQVQLRNPLPQITRFIAGMVTNRNPIDTPFSLLGLNVVQHHDALIDGLNMEVSAYNTLVRRPGFWPFTSTFSAQPRDFMQYKDLNGNITIFSDIGGNLYAGANPVQTYSGNTLFSTPGIANNGWNLVGGGLWSVVGAGNFVYAANSVNAIRMNNDSLTVAYPWGIATPTQPPKVTYLSANVSMALSDFIPTNDTIGGILVITAPSNHLIATYTINNTSIHCNITYSGNQISPNLQYTQVDVQSQTGTSPNTTTTDVITQTSGYTGTATGANITNGVVAYYPSTGISTIDFDIPFTAPLTLANFVNTIQNASYSISASNIPQSAISPLFPFVQFFVASGMVSSTRNGYPDTAAQAIQIAPYNSVSNINLQTLTYSSGLYDVTNPQYPIRFHYGLLPTFKRYVGPLVNLTDTFSGGITLTYGSMTAGAPTTTTLTFTSATLNSIASTINPVLSPVGQCYVVQLGKTGYLVIETLPNYSTVTYPLPTQDTTLTLSDVTLVDNSDLNLPIQFVPFHSNYMAILPTQQYQWAYAIRDTVTGHLSNLSPPTTVGKQIAPGIASVDSGVSALGPNQVVEFYRTVDGGSTFLFAGYANHVKIPNPTYIFIDYFTDDYLNTQLVGPLDEENDPPPTGLFGIAYHASRFWGIVDNRVYFSGGPDTVNGSGNEAWPPSNYFEFPGAVVSILPTASGLLVFLKDDVHIIRGVDSSSFYSSLWLSGFGISNPNAAIYDGQTIYLYTTKQQLHALSPNAQEEIGFNVGDILLNSFPAATTNLTLHRGSSLDYALYVSNGTDTILRFDPRMRAWSPKAQPLMGAGRVKSLEVQTGVNALLLGTPASGSNTIFFRTQPTVINGHGLDFSDNGTPFSAYATIGTILVAEPGTWTDFNNIAMQLQPQGSVPSVFVLNNEINPSVVPFTQLFNPVPDPPDLPAAQTLWAFRWYLKSSLTPIPLKINTTQIKIAFPAENAKNEILGVYLRATQ